MQVTGKEVKAAMMAAGITRVDHHDCGIYGSMVFYSRDGEHLFFNPGCECSWSPPKPRSWDDLAGWINMQTVLEVRNELRAAVGLPPEA